MGKEKPSAEAVISSIRWKTRRKYSAEEKIRIVLEGLRGEDSIAELCRREGISESLYYSWSKEFLEVGKKRLTGDTRREATTDEVKGAEAGKRPTQASGGRVGAQEPAVEKSLNGLEADWEEQ